MSKVKKSRVKLLHQYYKYTGFYSFIWQGVKGAILPTAVIGSLLFSFVGVFWAFLMTGTTMGIMGMIGMLALVVILAGVSKAAFAGGLGLLAMPLSQRLPQPILRRAFAVLLLVLGISLIVRQLAVL